MTENKHISEITKEERDAIRQEWIEALESGEYNQCKGTLCKVGHDKRESYCCLGVLCELLHRKGLLGKERMLRKRKFKFIPEEDYYECFYENKGGTLPIPVSLAIGLNGTLGRKTNCTTSLASLNDYMNFDFNQIAEELRTGKYFVDNPEEE